ncbi:hypothetical protein J4460_03980 [Candidatus Woesearchaeota archaeon]|nr:hypothetical protein [Candidatus Woesearchaeota archaeon]HIH38258.1 hypothetical protein [Candidatus Woesearchaeota archaeon]HIJ04414.1 hypothetical protein [Candidatus Woesearchaeota archaeon]
MAQRVERVDEIIPIRFAVMSCTDKTGLGEFATRLVELADDITILSTGGTYTELHRALAAVGREGHVEQISEYTGQPEIAGGLVKSLHHKLFLGYLTETDNPNHQEALEREGAHPIDLVVCNLYNFGSITQDPAKDMEDARGQIDIGGPSMIRAAAKNWLRVATIIDPSDFEPVLTEIQMNGGARYDTRRTLAARAFDHTAKYDLMIAKHLLAQTPQQGRAPYRFEPA